MEHCQFIHNGDRTLCLYNVKSDLGFVGEGEHENPQESERLAYEDAVKKSKVVPIKGLALYHWWKRNKYRV